MATPSSKSCVVCGRIIPWRRAWARDWEAVRYCSQGCRRHRLTAQDQALEAALREQLRAHGAADPGQLEGDREAARRAARRLVAQGEAVAVQGGRPVEVSTARGAFTLRRREGAP